MKTTVTLVLSHRKYAIFYGVGTTTTSKSKRPIFVMVSGGDRRLALSLVGHDYYGTVSVMITVIFLDFGYRYLLDIDIIQISLNFVSGSILNVLTQQFKYISK